MGRIVALGLTLSMCACAPNSPVKTQKTEAERMAAVEANLDQFDRTLIAYKKCRGSYPLENCVQWIDRLNLIAGKIQP